MKINQILPSIILMLLVTGHNHAQQAEIGKITIKKNHKLKQKSGILFQISDARVTGMKGERVHFGFNIEYNGQWLEWRSLDAQTMKTDDARFPSAGWFFYEDAFFKSKGVDPKAELKGCFFVSATDEDNRVILRKCVNFSLGGSGPPAENLPANSPYAGLPRLDKLATDSGDAVNPLNDNEYRWGVSAIFKKPEYEKNQVIRKIEIFKDTTMLLSDNSGAIFKLDTSRFNTIWKNQLESDHVNELAASPSNKTFAVSYTAKANYDYLEIRSASNGNILKKYTYLADQKCYDNTHTMRPWVLAYSPDGKTLAVWFHNFRSNVPPCIAIESDIIVLYDAVTGKERKIIKGIQRMMQKEKIICDGYTPIAFSADSKSLYFTGCSPIIVKINARTMRVEKSADFFSSMRDIIINQLGFELLRERFEIQSIMPDPISGGLFVAYGGQGEGVLMLTDKNLTSLKLITVNQGAIRAHMSVSPNKSMFMAGYANINLWDLKKKQALLYGETAFAHELARFHPKKRAIIYARDWDIRIISELPWEEKALSEGENQVGYIPSFKTVYCSMGSGRFNYIFTTATESWQDSRTHTNSHCTGKLGGDWTRRDNSAYEPVAVKVKATESGSFKLWGFHKTQQSNEQILSNLKNW